MHNDWSQRHWYHCWVLRTMTPVVSWSELLCTRHPLQTCTLCHTADCFLAWPTTEAQLCLPRAPNNLEPGDRRNTRERGSRKNSENLVSHKVIDCWVLWTSGDGLLGCVVKRKMTNNIIHTHLFHCGKHWVQSTDQRQLHLPR